MEKLNSESIVVGVDVHKYSHTAVAMDPWGQEKGIYEFTNDSLPSYAEWLNSFGGKQNIIVGLEDVNGYGIHLVEALVNENFHIRYVPAILTDRERKRSSKRHKSDYEDAKRVGKVILAKYEETLPAKESIANKQEMETTRALDMLLMERKDLVKTQTILKNQIHAFLHQYYGDHYADGFPKPFHKKAKAFYLNDLQKSAGNNKKHILAISIVRRLNRLVMIEEQITEVTKEMNIIGSKSKEVAALQEIHGCGAVTACAIMAEVATIKRFSNADKFAMYAGVAPTEKSSGSKKRLHTNPFGNRILNRALHTIALSQIACKGDDRGRVYFRRKVSEGKTKLWAMRCLKRQIAKTVFKTLKRQTAQTSF